VPSPADPPYPGLVAFGDGDADAERFFGRAAMRDLVIANLRSARITVLYGPSGVGKTSLLRAGVVHRLREAERPAPVVVLDDWGGDPAAALTAGVVAAAFDGEGAPADAALPAALARLHEREAGAVLVILDQFEEHLRMAPGGDAERFDDTLAALLREPELVVRVLIALRDDRLAELDRFDGRVTGVLANVLRLDPLSREAAHEAITGPIEPYNQREPDRAVSLEPGLADRVLDELGGAADGAGEGIAPAFLALTMRRLWDADTAGGGRTLRLATLEGLGGAGRIFATHLDEVMGGLSAAEQRLAAEMLRLLVTPSGATRSYSVADLSDYVGRSRGEIEALAEKLSRPPARVLRAVAAPAGTEYELAHPVLARPALDWRTRFVTERLQRRSRRLVLGLVAAVAIVVTLVGYVLAPTPLARLELHTVDARFAVRGAQAADREIVLVTIDAPAYARLLASPAPPRATVARAIDEITAQRPRALAVDVGFTGAKSPAGDQALLAAVQRAGPRLVLSTDTIDAMGQSMLFGSPAAVYSDHSVPAVGYAGFPQDHGGGVTVRHLERSVALPLGGEPMDTLAVVTARLAGAPAATLSRLPANAWVDFRGGAGTFRQVPLAEVLAGTPSALSRLRGRIVVLGITAPATMDYHDTSAPRHSVMSGPELQANAISNAVRRFPLRDAGRGWDIALIILLGLAPLALALVLRPVWCALGVLGVAALFCVGAQLAFDAGRVVNVVFPLVALALSGAGTLAVLVALGRGARRPGSTVARSGA
jgi:CHASE2 domain-containing sensor protein